MINTNNIVEAFNSRVASEKQAVEVNLYNVTPVVAGGIGVLTGMGAVFVGQLVVRLILGGSSDE